VVGSEKELDALAQVPVCAGTFCKPLVPALGRNVGHQLNKEFADFFSVHDLPHGTLLSATKAGGLSKKNLSRRE
jgi:hypothetical protein